MSIILDALRKARRDRHLDDVPRDDAIFRQMEYENISRRKKKKGRLYLIFILGFILFLIIPPAMFILLAYWGFFPRPSFMKGQRTFRVGISTPTPQPAKIIIQMEPVPTSVKPRPTIITQTPEPTPGPSPTPEPTPTPIHLRRTPSKTAPPVSLRRISTQTPAPPQSPVTTPRRSEFQQPEEYSIKLDGVMWDDRNPSALINGQIVGAGQNVDGWTIIKITKEYVEMKKDDVKYKFKY
jgi:hypothetical protein